MAIAASYFDNIFLRDCSSIKSPFIPNIYCVMIGTRVLLTDFIMDLIIDETLILEIVTSFII